MAEIRYTTLTRDLCSDVEELVKICFPDMPPEDQYSYEELIETADLFSEGTIVALDEKRVVGMGTGIFINLDFNQLPSTENELLYEDGILAHNDAGAYYYGSDMMVHPDYRGRRIGRQIYDRRKALVRLHNKVGFAAAAVLPGYADYKNKIGIQPYLDLVINGDVFDPTLSMQIRNGFRVIRPIKDFFFVYPKSDNWSALILWDNPDWKRSKD